MQDSWYSARTPFSAKQLSGTSQLTHIRQGHACHAYVVGSTLQQGASPWLLASPTCFSLNAGSTCPGHMNRGQRGNSPPQHRGGEACVYTHAHTHFSKEGYQNMGYDSVRAGHIATHHQCNSSTADTQRSICQWGRFVHVIAVSASPSSCLVVLVFKTGQQLNNATVGYVARCLSFCCFPLHPTSQPNAATTWPHACCFRPHFAAVILQYSVDLFW
jgi:hypothetical protein